MNSYKLFLFSNKRLPIKRVFHIKIYKISTLLSIKAKSKDCMTIISSSSKRVTVAQLVRALVS